MSDSGGNTAAGGGEASASGVENFVTEENQPGFKLRVRFTTAAECPRRGDGSGPSTTRLSECTTATTPVETHADADV